MDHEEFFKGLNLSELEYQLLSLKLAQNINFCPLEQKQKPWECRYHPDCDFCKVQYFMDLVYHDVGEWADGQRHLMKAIESRMKHTKPLKKSNVINLNYR